jgi:hypothetical protein
MLKYIIVSVISVVVCSVLPATVSAKRLSLHGAGHGWSEPNALLYFTADDLFDGPGPTGQSYSTPETLDNRSTIERPDGSAFFSDRGTRDSGGVSPEVSGSVNGYTGGPSSPFGGRSSGESSADPQVQGLSRMDGISGFGSPGSIGK